METFTMEYPMMATAARKSKVYTISLPPELARKAEALARRDSRTMSELFREAFRVYSALRARRTLYELGAYAAVHNSNGNAEADVPRRVQKVGADKLRRRKARSNG